MRGSPWYLCLFLGVAAASWAGRDSIERMGVLRPQPQAVQGEASAASEVSLPAEATASASRLETAFSRMDYHLDTVATSGRVPPVMLAQVPSDLADMEEPDQRKDVFIRMMLPLVLKVDERIAADRRHLEELAARLRQGGTLAAAESAWLAKLCDRYDVADGPRAINQLLSRVDIVPPSLAVAQAAIETGWGTSHLARRERNLFGHTIDRGEGVSADMAAFPTLLDAVEAYIHNLNTHRAYAGMRRARQLARHQGRSPEAETMAAELLNYSELGKSYVKDVRSVIRKNDLTRLDNTHLSDGRGWRTQGI